MSELTGYIVKGNGKELGQVAHVFRALFNWVSKTKTKVITTANQSKGNYQWQLEVNSCNRPVARENASDQGAIGFSLHLIGWEGGASFLDQSNSTVKQNQFNPGLLSTLNWKLF